jgi:hypothetical protein
MARAARTKEWIVYLIGGKRAGRLGTVTAPIVTRPLPRQSTNSGSRTPNDKSASPSVR